MKKYNLFLDGTRYKSVECPADNIRMIKEVMAFFANKGIQVLPLKAKINKESTTLYFETVK